MFKNSQEWYLVYVTIIRRQFCDNKESITLVWHITPDNIILNNQINKHMIF